MPQSINPVTYDQLPVASELEAGDQLFVVKVENGRGVFYRFDKSLITTKAEFAESISSVNAGINEVSRGVVAVAEDFRDFSNRPEGFAPASANGEWKLAVLSPGWEYVNIDNIPSNPQLGQGAQFMMEPSGMNPVSGIYYRWNSIGNLEISGGKVRPVRELSDPSLFQRQSKYISFFKLQPGDNERLFERFMANPYQALRNVGFYGSSNRITTPIGRISLMAFRQGVPRPSINTVTANELTFMASDHVPVTGDSRSYVTGYVLHKKSSASAIKRFSPAFLGAAAIITLLPPSAFFAV